MPSQTIAWTLPPVRDRLLGSLPAGQAVLWAGPLPARSQALIPGGAPGLLVARPARGGGWHLWLITPLGFYIYGWGNRRGHNPRLFHDRYDSGETASFLAERAPAKGRLAEQPERFPKPEPGQAWQRWTPQDEDAFVNSWREHAHDHVDDLHFPIMGIEQLPRRAAPVVFSLGFTDALPIAVAVLMVEMTRLTIARASPDGMLWEAFWLLRRLCIAGQTTGMDAVTQATALLRQLDDIGAMFADLLEGTRDEIKREALLADPHQPTEATVEEWEYYVIALLNRIPDTALFASARQGLEVQAHTFNLQKMAIRRMRDALRGLVPAITRFPASTISDVQKAAQEAMRLGATPSQLQASLDDRAKAILGVLQALVQPNPAYTPPVSHPLPAP